MGLMAEDVLEAIWPPGWDEPEPPEQRRVRAPKLLALVAGIVLAATVFALYAASAVASVRALERARNTAAIMDEERQALANKVRAAVVNEDDTATSNHAVQALLHEHHEWALAEADKAAATRAIDPGMRRLRDAVVSALLRDAHDLQHAFADQAQPQLGDSYAYADRELDRARRQWHLEPGRRPTPPPLRAADGALATLPRWSDERLGVRLLVDGGAGVQFLDLDGSAVRPTPPDLATHIAGRWSVPGRAETVWVQDQPGDPARAYDAAGRAVSQPTRPHGTFVADIGQFLVWHSDADQAVVLSDPETGNVVRRIEGHGVLVAASFRGLAWRAPGRPGDGPLRLTDLDGRPLTIPPLPDLSPEWAAFSPDGRRLAVATGAGPGVPVRLHVIDLGSGLVTPGVDVQAWNLRWAPDGTVVFFETIGPRFGYLRPWESSPHFLRLRHPARLVAVLRS
jgi:hypothetical protein